MMVSFAIGVSVVESAGESGFLIYILLKPTMAGPSVSASSSESISVWKNSHSHLKRIAETGVSSGKTGAVGTGTI